MPIPTGPNYPSLETIANMVRSICNDSFAGATGTPGEGIVLPDQLTTPPNTNNPLLLNHLNSSIRELYRKLRNVKVPTLIQDNYLVENLPPINGPLGPSQPDPTVQQWLDNAGFWDGSEYWTDLTPNSVLPTDLLLPLKIWERTSDTTDTFTQMQEVQDGLPPRDQTGRLVQWEWRADRINFLGAVGNRDIRLRYVGVFPQFFTADLDFTNTFVPIMDCEDFVAYKTAEKITLALGGAGEIVASLMQTAANHLFDLRNEQVRRMQRVTYQRQAYNDSDTAQELDPYGI
jgi:hypothetical protein